MQAFLISYNARSLQGKASGTPALPLSHLRSPPPWQYQPPEVSGFPQGALSVSGLPARHHSFHTDLLSYPCPIPNLFPCQMVWNFSPWLYPEFKTQLPLPPADGAEPRGTVCASFGAAWNPARARGCVLFIHSPSVSYTCGDSPQPQPHPLPASTNRPRPGWGWGSRRQSGDLEEQEGGSVRTGAHSLTVFSASPRIHAHSHPTETAGHAEETE